MKRIKQLFVSLLTCCLAFGIFPTTVRADENNWAKAYSEFIEEDTEDDLKLRDHAEYQLITLITIISLNYGSTIIMDMPVEKYVHLMAKR